jgi:serpin B
MARGYRVKSASMTPDPELLARYANYRDEAAFAELVHRHVDLVYATAFRLAQGNATLAEDASQAVFTDLARKAGTLLHHPTFTGWLHTSARYATLTALRKEQCRQEHEQEASAMNNSTHSSAESTWTQLRPLLDEALGHLRERDRDAVLLRFFQDKSYREVGDVLGVSENAAQMRVERALDKLRVQFSRRGVATTAALFSSALGVKGAMTPAPAGLSASIISQALTGAASGFEGLRGTGGLRAAPAMLLKTSWPVWVGSGAAAIALSFLIFHFSPRSNPLSAARDSTIPSPMKTSQIIQRGTLAATLLVTTPAAPAQPPVTTNAPTAASVPADAATISALVAANNRFAIDLFHQFNPKPNENAFFSPYSISTALAMTWAGAKGDTAAQLAKAFHFSEVPDNAVPASFAALQQAIAKAQTLSGCQLSIANSLWPEQNPEHPFLPDYLNLVQANYESSITPVDFVAHAADAAKQINHWVEDKINGKIKDLLQPGDVDELSRLVLVNAIYFKGAWMHPFTPSANSNTEFHSADGDIPAVLMHSGLVTYYADMTAGPAPCQILSLPYSNDSSGRTPQGVSFVVILPHAGTDLSVLASSLTAERLADWLNKLDITLVNVYLPKFRVEQRYLLADTLKALGIKDAFNPNRADFSGMDGARDLSISKVIHQTFVDVDEKGTEATAATVVEMLFTGHMQPVTAEFRADHPFLFLIRDNASGSILFLGQLANPAPLTEQIPNPKLGNGGLINWSTQSLP